jgi:hypothetical protein
LLCGVKSPENHELGIWSLEFESWNFHYLRHNSFNL